MTRSAQRTINVMLSLSLVWIAGGATCSRGKTINDFEPPPEIFKETPSREELAAAINRTDNIQKLQSTSASVEVVSSPILPKLTATLALERPRRISLRGSLPVIMGDAFNLGSNEEVFWMKVPEGISKTLYFAKHSEYQRQLSRAILPVDPTWLVDAIGLTHVDASLIREGPIVRSDGMLELKLAQPMADGVYQRVLAVDANRGVVTEQLLYGPNGRLLANATGEDFRYFAGAGCSLPHDVQIQLTPAGGQPVTLKLEVGDYVVNQLLSDDPRQFAMPQEGNDRIVDLSKVGAPLPLAVPSNTVPPPQPNYAPSGYQAQNPQVPTGYQPPVGYVPQTQQAQRYRGNYRIVR